MNQGKLTRETDSEAPKLNYKNPAISATQIRIGAQDVTKHTNLVPRPHPRCAYGPPEAQNPTGCPWLAYRGQGMWVRGRLGRLFVDFGAEIWLPLNLDMVTWALFGNGAAGKSPSNHSETQW